MTNIASHSVLSIQLSREEDSSFGLQIHYHLKSLCFSIFYGHLKYCAIGK
jgi:hypothetical protein